MRLLDRLSDIFDTHPRIIRWYLPLLFLVILGLGGILRYEASILYSENFLPYAERLAEHHVIARAMDPVEYAIFRSVTRAEVAKMVLPLIGTGIQNRTCRGNQFQDVTGGLRDGFCESIEILVDTNIVKSARWYGPKEKITRSELLKIVVRSMGMTADTCRRETFGDVGLMGGDLCGYIMTGVRTGIIAPNPFFRPEDMITRGEVFKIIYRAMIVMGRFDSMGSGGAFTGMCTAMDAASGAQNTSTCTTITP